MTTLTSAPEFHQPVGLAALAELDCDTLEARYREGKVPERFSVLDGTPKGRMLAVRGLDQALAGSLLRGLSGSTQFPWDGKSFSSQDAKNGRGINRIHVMRFQRDWFPFETRIETSHIDGKPCIYLDYDLPENPWFVRKIRDELREIEPGLLIGPAMWKRGEQPAALVLWFGIQAG